MKSADGGDLGEMGEVGVVGVEDQAVFQGEGGDPDVVNRDGRALLAQLGVEHRIVMGGGIGGVGGENTGLLEELGQQAGLLVPAFEKPGPHADFRQDDKRNPDLDGGVQPIDHLRIAGAVGDETVAIEQQAHRPISTLQDSHGLFRKARWPSRRCRCPLSKGEGHARSGISGVVPPCPAPSGWPAGRPD